MGEGGGGGGQQGGAGLDVCDKGSHFLVSHFLGWGAGRGQGGVGVGDVWDGGGVSMCLTRGHIFWCRTFWSGGWG